MAHYDIFRGQLAIQYPAYGHALWEPSPARVHSPVEIGDVGFATHLKTAVFQNIMRPLIPEIPDHISAGTLSPGHFCSTGVNLAITGPDIRALGVSKRGGAVLSLPVHAQRQDTLARGDFGRWIVKHIDRWFVFARRLGLGIEHMEEIILVTGCDLTRSWANIVFLGGQTDAQASFGFEGALLNQGPRGKNLPENQCIFIRGFRVARTLRVLPRQLRAAAKPAPREDDYDYGPNLGLISTATFLEHLDPLHLLIEYIAGRAPECDMVLVHDDDLASISEICGTESLETFQPDVVKSYLERLDSAIHLVPYGEHLQLSSLKAFIIRQRYSAANPQSGHASEDLDLYSPLTSVETNGLHCASEPSAIAPQIPESGKDAPLVSFTRSMREHFLSEPQPRYVEMPFSSGERMTGYHIARYRSPNNVSAATDSGSRSGETLSLRVDEPLPPPSSNQPDHIINIPPSSKSRYTGSACDLCMGTYLETGDQRTYAEKTLSLARKIVCDGRLPTCRPCAVRSDTCKYANYPNALYGQGNKRNKPETKTAAVGTSGDVQEDEELEPERTDDGLKN
ncbi:hypothetical protein F5148DRAFT_1280314 [Russula earlei]|uniref:Uncharacterized protein n=1 Tax=Russula earlei TaxID=71964 RepID=A0ACC0ULF1_9AGAM|nr:hypothetical protein F5148DRAFT_1280314 [Russula earlei]